MIYVNIRPLFEANFTGISQLSWHVARYWLDQPAERIRFFSGLMEVNRDAVETLVMQRTGRYWTSLRHRWENSLRPISIEDAKRSVALFPHSRDSREKLFASEIQVFHDLTGIITPEFHPHQLAAWEARRALHDIQQIDCFICVSEASRQDLIIYFGVHPDSTEVVYPGVEWFPEHWAAYQRMEQTDFGAYALVLGTFEPRKNIELVFDYILANPRILDDYVFCFCGAEGWGGVYQRCIRNPKIAQFIASGRIRILPFVNEQLKLALLKEASFLIYPSFLEGFGSPVAEAMSLGVPVVLSFGGSLPEVAGDAGYYFDPTMTQSLSEAIERVLSDLARDNAGTRLAAERQGKTFTWVAFNSAVHRVIDRFTSGDRRCG